MANSLGLTNGVDEFSKNKLEGLFKRVELRDEYYFLQYASNRA